MSYFVTSPLLPSFALFLALLLCLETGRRLGIRWRQRHGAEVSGTSTIDGAVLALFGLLVAFAFSGAASRFDERRSLIVQEANAIGTAYLRLDLLGPADRPALQTAFRAYADARLQSYGRDAATAEAGRTHAAELQKQIWTGVLTAAKSGESSPSATMLLVPALNEMIDLTTTRAMAVRMHPPAVIFVLLIGVALIGALLSSYALSNTPERNWVHMLSFALVVTLAVYVIADLEYPRLGLLRVDDFDSALIDARRAMDIRR